MHLLMEYSQLNKQVYAHRKYQTQIHASTFPCLITDCVLFVNDERLLSEDFTVPRLALINTGRESFYAQLTQLVFGSEATDLIY